MTGTTDINDKRNRNIAMAAVLALALLAGVLTTFGAPGNNDTELASADGIAPVVVEDQSADGAASTSADPSTPAPAPAPPQPGPDNGGAPEPQQPEDPQTPSAATPTIGAITLTSDVEEVVVTDLTVSVVNGNGTVTPFIDIDAAPQVTLLPGQPLTLSNGAASGIDPADINRIEVDFFEHMFAREVQVSAEDNGSFSVTIPKRNTTDGTWTLSFTVDGLV